MKYFLFSLILFLFLSSCVTYSYDPVTVPDVDNLPDTYVLPTRKLDIMIAKSPVLQDLERILEYRGHRISHIESKDFAEFIKSDSARNYDAVLGLLSFSDKKYFGTDAWDVVTFLTVGLVPSYNQYGYTYEAFLFLPEQNKSGKIEWVLKEKKWRWLFSPIVNAVDSPNHRYMVEYTRMQLKVAYLLEALVTGSVSEQ